MQYSQLNSYVNVDAGLGIFNFNANLVAVIVISVVASCLNRLVSSGGNTMAVRR